MKNQIIFFLLIFFYLIGCNTNGTKTSDSCFTLYKIIVRPDNSVADSIFINCTNKNLFFHKKMYDGKLVNTGYMLNNKLHGVFTIYDKDGKTILSKEVYENGDLKK